MDQPEVEALIDRLDEIDETIFRLRYERSEIGLDAVHNQRLQEFIDERRTILLKLH